MLSPQPLPPHRVCPNSGAMLFDPHPSKVALEQIKRISGAMLKVTEALAKGEAPPEDALTLMSELGR